MLVIARRRMTRVLEGASDAERVQIRRARTRIRTHLPDLHALGESRPGAPSDPGYTRDPPGAAGRVSKRCEAADYAM